MFLKTVAIVSLNVLRLNMHGLGAAPGAAGLVPACRGNIVKTRGPVSRGRALKIHVAAAVRLLVHLGVVRWGVALRRHGRHLHEDIDSPTRE